MKFEIWDTKREKFLSKDEVMKAMGERPLIAQNYFGLELKIPKDCIMAMYSGFNDDVKWDQLSDEDRKAWTDSPRNKEDWKGFELYDGYIIENGNKLNWIINWNVKTSRFEQMRIGGPGEIYEMRHNVKKLIGNKFRNTDLVK